MDNRRAVIALKPMGRKRRVIVSDMVSGSFDSFSRDHFKFSDIGKGIAKGVTSLVTKDKAKEAEKLAAIDAKYANSKGVKVLDKTVGIGLGLLAGLTGAKALTGGFKKAAAPRTPSIDTSGFKPSMVKPSGPSIVRSVTPMISPLPPSVPSTPGDAAMEAAAQESQETNDQGWLAGAVEKAAGLFTPEQRAAIMDKGRAIAESGKASVLTAAQKRLQELSTTGAMLPKTKSLKDAEALLMTPQHTADASSLSGLSMAAKIGIGLSVAGIIVAIYYGSR